MNTGRPSRKTRALEQALGKDEAGIAAEWAPKPLNYHEIAKAWTVEVRRAFPELDLRFSYSDVFRLFKAHGYTATRGAEKAAV